MHIDDERRDFTNTVNRIDKTVVKCQQLFIFMLPSLLWTFSEISDGKLRELIVIWTWLMRRNTKFYSLQLPALYGKEGKN